MSKNEMGLVFGFFVAIVHIIWNLFVWLLPEQTAAFIVWVCGLHGFALSFELLPVTLLGTVILAVLGFIFGYIFGFIFGWLVKRVKK